MAIYDNGTASLAANGRVTGVGTQWTMPLTLIRVGATIIFKTNPLKIYTISEITSDTSLVVYNPNSETVPAGTGYAILAHDGISVQGLAQDVAETLRYYQSKETSIQGLLDFIGQDSFDWPRFEQLANQSVTGAADALASQIAAADSAATAVSARNTTTAARDATIAAINNAGDAGTLAYLSQHGIGSSVTIQLSELDWDTFDFKSGGRYICSKSAMTNIPEVVDVTYGQNTLCVIEVKSTRGINATKNLQISASTTGDNAYRVIDLTQTGTAPNKQYYSREALYVASGSQTGGASAQRVRGLLDVYSKGETFDKSANLSDVDDKQTARRNLDVYSKSEVDSIAYANFSDASHYKNSLEDGGTVNIECFGDSTMWGSTSLNSSVQNTVNPPAILQRTLNLLYGVGKVDVTNRAIPGTALFSMLAGTDGSGSTFEAKMQASTANIVYCNHAQNDCNSLLRTVLQYKADLVTFVNICRKYGKVPVLVTPNLTAVFDGITEQVTKRLPAFVDAMRETAKEMGVDMVDNHYYTVKASRYISLYDIVPDGVHPGTDIYYMCGSNLAIPIVAHRVLYKPGDVTGLSNVRYRDNISSGRNFSNADNIFSKQLSWNAIEGQTGIWFPFVLDNPTDDTVISICGFQWGGGGKTIIGYKDSLSDARLSGTIDQYRIDTTDESAYFIPETCRLLPGLHVINILNHSLVGGATSSFSGIKLIKRQDTGVGYPYGGGSYAPRLIHVNDVIIKDVYVSSGVGEGGVLFLLRDARTSTQQSLTISNSGGTITFGMANGPLATLATGVQSGLYTITVELNSNRTVTVRLGGLVANTLPADMPLSTSFVATSGLYSVRKP